MTRLNLFLLSMAVFAMGCSDAPTEQSDAQDGATASSNDSATVGEGLPDSQDSSSGQEDSEPYVFKSISSGGSADSGAAGDASEGEVDTSLSSVMEKLKPLQVVLGKWRGTTRKEYEGFKAVDVHEWIWDLNDTPSLTLESDKSPYLRKAILSWDGEEFTMRATDADGVARDYRGEFTEPVREVVGDDDKLHRVFTLEFTQTTESWEKVGGETWRFAFNQQENNRYLLEVSKRRGTAKFRRYDTVSTQREGTSFALSDSDYGERTCIISQGLGTTTVSYKGKSYWVCCSGCRAAFEDDPEKWIAIAAKRAAEEKE